MPRNRTNTTANTTTVRREGDLSGPISAQQPAQPAKEEHMEKQQHRFLADLKVDGLVALTKAAVAPKHGYDRFGLDQSFKLYRDWEFLMEDVVVNRLITARGRLREQARADVMEAGRDFNKLYELLASCNLKPGVHHSIYHLPETHCALWVFWYEAWGQPKKVIYELWKDGLLFDGHNWSVVPAAEGSTYTPAGV
jgi:hypothetical protein